MKRNTQLKSLNTFSIDVQADDIITIYDELSLLKLWQQNHNHGKSVLILGEGSNILFLENYKGIVLLNRIRGIIITENKTEWKLHIGSGEKWNELVRYTIDQDIPGLENLACIPGYVGAAPIHNIGAYGLELSQICEYVDVLDLNHGNKIRLYNHDCHFQYRNSVFKRYLNQYAIVSVGLKLNKVWKPILNYFDFINIKVNLNTPLQIFNTVKLIRNNKLPNPLIHGNAGSFFKNPIISYKKVHDLIKNYSYIPYYTQSNGTIKLLAGWLIEQCKLKGYILGEASVYYKQAVVLINTRQKATGIEIAKLALYIRNMVLNKFNIYLQPEVRFIGNKKEIDPEQLFKKLNIL